MIRYSLIFLTLFALLALQGGFVANFGLGFVGNLLLLFTIITVVLGTFEESFFTVLVGGLMLDLVSGTRAGLNIISLFVVFGFTYLFINKFVPREPNRLILLICVAINTVLFAVSFVILNRFLHALNVDRLLDFRFVLGRKLLLDLLANVLLAYPMLYVYNLTQNLKTRLERLAP